MGSTFQTLDKSLPWKAVLFPGDSKTDIEGYRTAVKLWHERKAEIDGTNHWEKPNAKHL